ncbi:sulfotransferase family protein [Nocardioides caricicola]|uniref:Sulfotransferase family protein n=1 Tax=Nocardioides caricicola TaxID=634770 RepID=A0ABW0N444_9ACTN
MTDYPRTVLFVAGAGRSGTSTMAGLMQILGLHVPQPEVVADESNPKGFGEPQWVVENHDRLLRDALVQVSDARPDAWVETDRISGHAREQERAAQWLEGHFASGSELVVKDPRLSWFLTLWRAAAARTGARPVFTTMLRPPAEVVGSRQTYYQSRLGSAHLAASWLNVLLHTELATRGSDRAFVRYADLLSDWKRAVLPLGEQLGLQHVQHASPAAIEEGDRFVDPDLRRMTQTLEDLALPPRLHELTAQTWAELNRLAEPGGDTPEVHEALDELRAGYVDLYAESEAITRSSVVAAEQRGRRTAAKPAAPAPSAADRVPHGVRALVPARVRRGLRKALRRPRS